MGTPPGVTLSSPRVIGASKDSLAIYSDDQGVVLVPREGAQPYRGKVVDSDTASSFGDAIAFDADSAYWVSDKKLKRVKVDSTTTGSASSLDDHVLTAFSFGNRIYYSVYDPSADGVGGVIRRAEGDATPTLVLRRKLKIERFAITPSALFWAEASGSDGFCIMKKAMTFDAGTGP